MLYADTADLEELEEMLSLGLFSGITTNQKILLKANPEDYEKRLEQLCEISPGSVSVELTQSKNDYDQLILEAHRYHTIDPDKIVIKVPMWGDGTGVYVARELSKLDIPVNMTCLMSVNQALLGCLSNVRYVSLFYNRMADYYQGKDKNKEKGKEIAGLVFGYTRRLIDRFGWKSKIIAGSIREPTDVAMCLMQGADIVTVPFKIYRQLFTHPKSEETIAEFDKAWLEYKHSNKALAQ